MGRNRKFYFGLRNTGQKGKPCFLQVLRSKLALNSPAKQMVSLVLGVFVSFLGGTNLIGPSPGTAFVWSIRKRSMFCWSS